MGKVIMQKTTTRKSLNGTESTTDVTIVGRPAKWESDGMFLKVYPAFLSSFMEQMKYPLDARLRLVVYILNEALDLKINGKNAIYIDTGKACKSINVSKPSLYRYIKVLTDAKFIKHVRSGLYMINPDMVYKGNLVKYYQQSAESFETDNSNE